MQLSEHKSSTPTRSFDSLAYAKHMEAVGFTRQQAEALAEEQGKLIDERLATKLDLHEMDVKFDLKFAEIKLDLRQTEARLETKILETKAEIIKWVVSFGFAQVAMIIAALKLHF